MGLGDFVTDLHSLHLLDGIPSGKVNTAYTIICMNEYGWNNWYVILLNPITWILSTKKSNGWL